MDKPLVLQFIEIYMKFGFKCLAALQVKMFGSLHLNDLEQRSNNDLDLWYCYVFMYAVSQLLVPTFSSQTSIVSIKSSIQAFSHIKA